MNRSSPLLLALLLFFTPAFSFAAAIPFGGLESTFQPSDTGVLPSGSGQFLPTQLPGGSTQSSGSNGGTQSSGNGSAQSSGSNTTCLTNPLSVGGNGCNGSPVSIPQFIKAILGFVVQIGSVIVVLMLVYIGFLFVSARGEPGAITKARQALLWTIVGALLLLGAQVIASGIQATVNALSTGP